MKIVSRIAENLKNALEKERGKGDPVEYEGFLIEDIINVILKDIEMGNMGQADKQLEEMILSSIPNENMLALIRMARVFDFIVQYITISGNDLDSLKAIKAFTEEFLKIAALIERLAIEDKPNGEIVTGRALC